MIPVIHRFLLIAATVALLPGAAGEHSARRRRRTVSQQVLGNEFNDFSSHSNLAPDHGDGLRVPREQPSIFNDISSAIFSRGGSTSLLEVSNGDAGGHVAFPFSVLITLGILYFVGIFQLVRMFDMPDKYTWDKPVDDEFSQKRAASALANINDREQRNKTLFAVEIALRVATACAIGSAADTYGPLKNWFTWMTYDATTIVTFIIFNIEFSAGQRHRTSPTAWSGASWHSSSVGLPWGSIPKATIRLTWVACGGLV
jgi:hypothetical protein